MLSPRFPGTSTGRRCRGIIHMTGAVPLYCAAALLAFTASFLTASSGRPSHTDDAWFLNVCARVLNGEVLYRDTFCGVTPLAFYFHIAAAKLLGNTAPLLQLIRHLLFATTAVLTLAISRAVNLPLMASAILIQLLLLWSTPVLASPYTHWALLFLLGTWLAAIRLIHGGRTRWAMVAGAMAGLAFAAKQNVGLLALGALLAVVAAHFGRRSARPALTAIASFLCAIAPFLATIAASGAWPWFISQGFSGKSVYLARFWRFALQGAVNLTPIGEIREFGVIEGLLDWCPATIYYAAPVLLFLLIHHRRDPHARVIPIFAAAGLTASLPVPDAWHLLLAAPGLAVACAYAWWKSSLHPFTARVLGGLLCILLAGHLWLSERYRPAAPAQDLKPLLAHAANGALLVLHPAAPLFYFNSNLRNPTRYDYPLVTPFGRTGQQEVIRQIREGSLDRVCLHPLSGEWMTMAPEQLIRFVHTSMVPGPDLGPCRIYTSPTGK